MLGGEPDSSPDLVISLPYPPGRWQSAGLAVLPAPLRADRARCALSGALLSLRDAPLSLLVRDLMALEPGCSRVRRWKIPWVDLPSPRSADQPREPPRRRDGTGAAKRTFGPLQLLSPCKESDSQRNLLFREPSPFSALKRGRSTPWLDADIRMPTAKEQFLALIYILPCIYRVKYLHDVLALLLKIWHIGSQNEKLLSLLFFLINW